MKINEEPDHIIIDRYYAAAMSGINVNWLNSLREEWYDYITSLPNKERTTYLIAVLDDQIYNGGLNQYFVNGYGQFAFETITALEQIGALASAELLRKAYDSVNASNYDGKEFRNRLVAGEIDKLYDSEELDSYLDALDDTYVERVDDIGRLLIKYLQESE